MRSAIGERHPLFGAEFFDQLLRVGWDTRSAAVLGAYRGPDRMAELACTHCESVAAASVTRSTLVWQQGGAILTVE
jgi:hypothetical protein